MNGSYCRYDEYIFIRFQMNIVYVYVYFELYIIYL